jgi:hypothetical protein
MKAMKRLVAITHEEWLQWIAEGQLRCGARVREVPDQESEATLHALLECAPGFSVRNDQALVFAILTDTPAAISNRTLPLECVREFFPLNERGAQLIEGDARRARVRLGTPHLACAFESWRTSELDRTAHETGHRFVLSAGFSHFAAEREIEPLSRQAIAWKPTTFSKYERRRNSVSFGWRVALAKLHESMEPQLWEQFSPRVSGFEFPKEADAPCASGSSICDYVPLRQLAHQLRGAPELAGLRFSLVQRAALAHWLDRLEVHDGAGLQRPEELRALARDLRIIEADEGTERAIEAAYLIGRAVQRDTVNQLYYAKNCGQFPALSVTAHDGWLGEPVVGIAAINERVAEPVGDRTAESVTEQRAVPSADQSEGQSITNVQSREPICDVISTESARSSARLDQAGGVDLNEEANRSNESPSQTEGGLLENGSTSVAAADGSSALLSDSAVVPSIRSTEAAEEELGSHTSATADQTNATSGESQTSVPRVKDDGESDRVP